MDQGQYATCMFPQIITWILAIEIAYDKLSSEITTLKSVESLITNH